MVRCRLQPWDIKAAFTWLSLRPELQPPLPQPCPCQLCQCLVATPTISILPYDTIAFPHPWTLHSAQPFCAGPMSAFSTLIILGFALKSPGHIIPVRWRHSPSQPPLSSLRKKAPEPSWRACTCPMLRHLTLVARCFPLMWHVRKQNKGFCPPQKLSQSPALRNPAGVQSWGSQRSGAIGELLSLLQEFCKLDTQ